MVALIRAEAERQGVDPKLALATAEVESNFNPRAAGDLGWATWNDGARYKQHVLGNDALTSNPARLDPSVWHSYGLFQLLAPYHVTGREHPSVLYDPAVNAQRGVAYLRALAKRYGGDPAQVRLAYAGALHLDAASQERALTRFAKAFEQWGGLG